MRRAPTGFGYREPVGGARRKLHDGGVNPGKRPVSFVCLLCVGALLAASDARAPAAARAPGVLVDAELAPRSAEITLLDCSAADDLPREELRFERIDTDLDGAELRRLLSRHGQRMVGFAWDAATGELSYDARTELMPPAALPGAASSLVVGSCVSR
jgi:hypothetical protein